ncbi:MAG TPA: IPT/TIG domain-containing protein [Thermoanaerobaculia bacterium]
MKRFTLLLLLVAALPLAAQEEILVLPPGPTTDTFVTLRLDVYCNPILSHTVTRTGTTIVVAATPRGGTCPSPPLPLPYDVELGFLPSGQYTVEVRLPWGQTFTESFIVRNAKPGLVDVRPFAVPMMPIGSRLRLASDMALCAGEDCSGVTVTVGGVVVPGNRLSASSDGSVFFTPPPHAPGLVDVSVTANGVTRTTPNALYYYDPAAEPDPSVWERILFPVLFNSGGAHGSEWVSEAAIFNPGRWFVENFNRIDTLPCIDYGCTGLLSPNGFLSFGGSSYVNGVALLVPRPEAEHVAFSLRVRDVARQAEGFGTEVPVVREEDLYAGTITLLDVPLDPRYRTKVRLYAFDGSPFSGFVALHDPKDGTRVTGHAVPMRRSCSGIACAWTPAYGELDLPSGSADERVNVYVTAGQYGSKGWAFASITNNDTQQVTIVTPDGRGGLPCNPCQVK